MFARPLGPLEIELEGRPVPLGGRAPRALLARLLLDANHAVAVDRLVEDLWGEEAPASAVKMIQIHVSALRKVLPEGMLVTRPRGYALEIDPDAVDLVRFEALRREGQEALATGSHELGPSACGKRARCGAARRWASSTSPSPRSSRRGSRSCGWPRSRTGSRLSCRSAATPASSASSTRWWPGTRCASASAAS